VSSRFTSNLTIAVLGAVLATTSLVFGAGTVGWLAFGVGCAATLVALIGFAWSGRGSLQRCFDVIVALLGAWMIVSSRALPVGTLRWLSFSEAAALFALAVAGLVAHEVVVQRELRVARESAARERPRPIEFPEPLPEHERSRRMVTG
jgi:hypothetical protein